MRNRPWRGWAGSLMLLVAVAGSVAAGSAFDDLATQPLESLLELARTHAPKLQDARAKVVLARLDVRATQWWTWLVPSVTAHQGYDFLSGQERAAVALSLDVSKLLGAGAREATRAELGLAQAERTLAAAEADLTIEVTEAAFRATTARATVEVRETAVADTLKLEALERIKFEHGTGDLAPLLQARAGLARARLELLQAQQAEALASLTLARTIGLVPR
jgi:outer membrane protein TolC